MENNSGYFNPEEYDNWYKTQVGQTIDRLEKKAVQKILPSVGSNEIFLEIGCGTGHWTWFFSELGYKIIGLDIDKNMLRAAKNKDIKNAVFVQADASNLPFKDNSFDICGAITVLEFTNDFQKALKEMYRCTKPGGKLIVGALSKCSYMGLWRKFFKRKKRFKKAHFFGYAEFKKLLSQYGKTKVISSTYCFPYNWSTKIADFLERTGKTFFRPWGNFLVGVVNK